MPIYEFTCKSCGKDSEVLVRSDANWKCEHCGSSDLIRKISLAAYNKSSGAPACSSGCGGFENGSCGSGMCGSH